MVSLRHVFYSLECDSLGMLFSRLYRSYIHSIQSNIIHNDLVHEGGKVLEKKITFTFFFKTPECKKFLIQNEVL